MSASATQGGHKQWLKFVTRYMFCCQCVQCSDGHIIGILCTAVTEQGLTSHIIGHIGDGLLWVK